MIQGKLINLRIMEERDLEHYIHLTNDYNEKGEFFPAIIRTPSATKRIFAETGFFSAEGGRMLIVNKYDEILGYVSFFPTTKYINGYELGYQIFKSEHRNKGYVSEALKLFTAFMFEYFNITRLQICMEVGNDPSEHVAKKCGYQYEGTMRNVCELNGRMVHNKLYSMIRREAPFLKDLL
ncbi:MAG: GNAT family N-acetyltransferase [Clostridia bacterium]|nr:GNAT family N-acetyltransferase [Clostridia bacterium]